MQRLGDEGFRAGVPGGNTVHPFVQITARSNVEELSRW
jgi:hypothetical protein